MHHKISRSYGIERHGLRLRLCVPFVFAAATSFSAWDEDGSTDIHFGPTDPDGMANNWRQTVAGKGCFVSFRLHNPLQPFFAKAWRPGQIEPSALDAG